MEIFKRKRKQSEWDARKFFHNCLTRDGLSSQIFYISLLLGVFCESFTICGARRYMSDDGELDDTYSYSSNSGTSDWNSLSIVPISKNRVYQRALGKSSIFTCTANVELPERLNDFRWWWPDGRAIEATDSSEGFYDEARVEIMKDRPGSLTLLFPAIQEQDLGTYRCSATYDNTQQLTTDFTLRAYVPITFEDFHHTQYAVKGENFKLICSVRSDPEPLVDWKKDHRVINDSDHYIIHKDGVVIRAVTEEDEGVYTCRVRVTSMGTVEERHILVEVHERPVLLSPSEIRVEGVEHENVTLRCAASGKPTVEYEWQNERGQNVREMEDERYVVDKYEGTLRIESVRKDDQQLMKCTARNHAGYVTMLATLSVVTKPVIQEFQNVTTQAGTTALLKCKAFGDPPPDIRFHKSGNREPFVQLGPQQDSRIFVDQLKEGDGITMATLKITDVNRADDGLYSCTAYNQRTEVTIWGHLTVQFPPTFLNTPMREAWSWDSRPVNLSCLAEAIPNATITWFIERDPNEVAVDQYTANVKQIEYLSRSTLQVYPVDNSMYGSYKCRAINTLGFSETRISLRKARKPGPMLEAILHDKTATTLAYKLVGPVEDGGLPIKSFLAQYKKEGDSWVQHRLKTWPVDRQIFVIEGLQPQQTYTVRFAAENDVGLGNWALEKTEGTPRRSAPDLPFILNEVVRDYAITAYPDKFQLIWKLPPDNGERIEAFEITYEPVRNITLRRRGMLVDELEWDSIGQKQKVEKLYHPSQPRLTLRNLAPDTFYRVEIRARNRVGLSPPDQIVFKTATVPGEAWGPLRSPVTSSAALGKNYLHQNSFVFISMHITISISTFILSGSSSIINFFKS